MRRERRRATIPDEDATRPASLVDHRLEAEASDRLLLTDITLGSIRNPMVKPWALRGFGLLTDFGKASSPFQGFEPTLLELSAKVCLE